MARKKTTMSSRKRQAILREMLEERRQEINDKLRSLRESLPAELAQVRDAEEQSLDDFVHEVDFALMQMKTETLHRIDDALGRLGRGAYGVCAECGGEIAEARLSALPFAEFCRICQESLEQSSDLRPTSRLEFSTGG
jgi:DnaK suppressor protein